MNHQPQSAATPILPTQALWQRSEFVSATLRASAIVASVVCFSLGPAAAVVLIVLEAWIYMTLRAAVDGAFEDEGLGFLQQMLFLPLIAGGAGLIYGALLSPFLVIICVGLYDVNTLLGFIAALNAEPDLALSAGALILVELIDAGRYALSVRRGSRAPLGSLQLSFFRVAVLLLPAALVIQAGISPTVAGWILLIAMVLSILYFEGFPARARLLFSRR